MNTKRFRRRPVEVVEVDAMQLDAHNGAEIVQWIKGQGGSAFHSRSQGGFHFLHILDNSINLQINLGEDDWAVRYEDGRFTRFSPAEFEKFYEAAG